MKYAPEIEKRLRCYWKPLFGFSWKVDATYVNVKRKYTYLHQALDKFGHTGDFYLSSFASMIAVKRFLDKALKSLKTWGHPTSISKDKAESYGAALK